MIENRHKLIKKKQMTIKDILNENPFSDYLNLQNEIIKRQIFNAELIEK